MIRRQENAWRLRRLAAAGLPALLLAACAGTPAMHTPANLTPAANETLAMIVPAKGVQSYECRARKDASGYEWAFVAPDATLFDARGRKIGTHGAGPFWQAAAGSSAR
jgi:hypothetical protein